MKKSPVYTCTGDCGTTSLNGPVRVSKAETVIHAIGTVDELNAHLGLCYTLCKSSRIKHILNIIQNDLFTVGAQIAAVTPKDINIDNAVKGMNSSIDLIDSTLPSLGKFIILPGGTPASAQLHIARAVCRRAERYIVELGGKEKIGKYFNRLSDLLFVFARSELMESGGKDIQADIKDKL